MKSKKKYKIIATFKDINSHEDCRNCDNINNDDDCCVDSIIKHIDNADIIMGYSIIEDKSTRTFRQGGDVIVIFKYSNI